MPEYETLSVEVGDDRIATVTISRPKKLNALNHTVMQELDDAFATLGTNDVVGGVILTGAGEKAFVAGADIGELAELNPDGARQAAQFGQAVLGRIEGLGKPVIAAINGFALGGGCETALACHLRVASTRARIGLPEVKLGIMPGYGGTQRLARIVGTGRALEWILTGEFMTADEAYRIGLVNRVFEPDELLDGARELLGTILSRGPIAVSHAIDATVRGLGLSLDEGLRLEADLFGLLFATEDKEEGTKAFLEKREPDFKGR